MLSRLANLGLPQPLGVVHAGDFRHQPEFVDARHDFIPAPGRPRNWRNATTRGPRRRSRLRSTARARKSERRGSNRAVSGAALPVRRSSSTIRPPAPPTTPRPGPRDRRTRCAPRHIRGCRPETASAGRCGSRRHRPAKPEARLADVAAAWLRTRRAPGRRWIRRRRARRGRRAVPRVNPQIRPRASASQYGAPKPAKAGTRYTPPESGTDSASAAAASLPPGRLSKPADPLHGAAGVRDIAFERVLHVARRGPRHGGRKAVARRDRSVGQGHQRGAGTIRRLHGAGVERRMAEQRRVRIADQAADRNSRRQPTGRHRPPKTPLDGSTRGRQERGMPNSASRSASHSRSFEVQQLGARSVGDVGGVHGAAGEVPQQPAIHRADAQIAWFGARRPSAMCSISQRAFDAENSGSTARPERRRIYGSSAALAQVGRRSGAVRRHCHTMHGPSGSPDTAIPSHYRLALVRDANSDDLGAGRLREAVARRLRAPIATTPPRPARPIPAGETRSASGRDARAATAPDGAISSAFVLVVPWSIAKMSFARATIALLSQFQSGIPDVGRGQPEMLEQESGRSGGRELAGNAQHPHANRMGGDHHFGNGAAQAAEHRVFFHGDDGAGLAASAIASRSSGRTVERFRTPALTPSLSSSTAASSARHTIVPAAMRVMSVPSRSRTARPISNWYPASVDHRHGHAAEPQENGTVERGGGPHRRSRSPPGPRARSR